MTKSYANEVRLKATDRIEQLAQHGQVGQLRILQIQVERAVRRLETPVEPRTQPLLNGVIQATLTSAV